MSGRAGRFRLVPGPIGRAARAGRASAVECLERAHVFEREETGANLSLATEQVGVA